MASCDARRDMISSRRTLIVLGRTAFARYELPDHGEVVIGRSASSDLAIDDPSITRRHARLHIGRALEIEDLGSVNGTRVRERRLATGQRIELRAGEAFYLGTALAMIHVPAPAPTPHAQDDIVTYPARPGAATPTPAPAREPRRTHAPVVVDPTMRALYAMVDKIAPGTINVLVLGETGVGKELVAERI